MTESTSRAFFILGDQLFPLQFVKEIVRKKTPIFMAESKDLATHYKYHKHKIIFFFAAMRSYRDALRRAGYHVEYRSIDMQPEDTFIQKLTEFIQQHRVSQLGHFEIDDKFFVHHLAQSMSQLDVELRDFKSPKFLVSRDDFKQYLAQTKKPFMKTFYEQQRIKLRLLVDETPQGLKPMHGKFSFDDENRHKIPKGVSWPELPVVNTSSLLSAPLEEVSRDVEKFFADHVGDAKDFFMPINREQALQWLQKFIDERLQNYGEYQDAIEPSSSFLWHSLLSPLLNIGLLTPAEVVEHVSVVGLNKRLPFNSLEGFVRQVIGWREFIRGIYDNFSEQQDSANFFSHHRRLGQNFYRGQTGVPVVDDCIQKANKTAYCNHIERLMVLSNFLLLCETKPTAAHQWFMEMFIDSSDWVMGPNVYGMGLFSDGGIFATKPYICGSNYWLKMSSYKKGPWCDAVDGLYWQFIDRHREFFVKNHRMRMMVSTVDKMSADRKLMLYKKAEILRSRVESDQVKPEHNFCD